MKIVSSFLGIFGLFLLQTSCAGKTSTGLKGTATGERAGAAGQKGAEATKNDPEAVAKEAEKPIFVRSMAPMQLKCDAGFDLPFMLSEGLSPKNTFLLARFGTVGSTTLPFDAVSLTKWLNGVGFAKVKLLESKAQGVQGFVATSARMNLVVFRGTHSLEGVMTDSKFLVQSALTDGLPGGVHQGFALAYRSVAANLAQELEPESSKSVPTFFVGHSLGGALATLAALDMHRKGVNIAGMVTLGQPRVGNASFAAETEKILAGKQKRFVNANDPVPHLPPSGASADVALNSVLEPSTRGTTLALLNGIGALTGMTFAKANFTHAGVPDMLGQADYAKGRFESDAVWDGKYWNSNGQKVQQVVANLAAAMQNPLVNEHFVPSYLCELAKTLAQ
ncbi:MAG: lipase family protein [Betaproteobacteria bacterium]|nr:lipase family protein [Betaproteobacteria bacterium]